MQTEIEAKWVEVDHDELRQKLEGLGAKMVYPEVLMKRVVFDSFGNKSGEWARVRAENDKVTMSYKRVVDESVTGMSEVTLEIDSFEKGIAFLTEVGLERKAFQETKRELWVMGDTEITLDAWPWLPKMVEIEAKSEEELAAVAEKLGLNMTEAMYASADYVYARYYGVEAIDDINLGKGGWGEIVFSDVPEWLEKIRLR